ncbi:MAG: pilus assembly protein TadG-related protein [bacterium]|nr:pilus assembly protein TadG-related protein [candidate division KSB1 bacterium]MDH7560069.1 pilus assembly protein TadG-related protein [bacterium]
MPCKVHGRGNRKALGRNERGGTLAVSAVALFICLLVCGLAIDIGAILVARSQLQAAADAAALAGARGLINGQEAAIASAIQVFGRNKVQNRALSLAAEEVSFPGAGQVEVRVTRPVEIYFLQLVRANSVDVSARAVAAYGSARSVVGLKPWAVPDLHWLPGDAVVLKAGPQGEVPSWRYPVCFPPLNRGNPVTGAAAYQDAIVNGSSMAIEIGDELLLETGDMVGPTRQAVDQILALDPDAWLSPSGIQGSRYPGDSSPRICKIALLDPNSLPGPGRSSVTVVRFGVFFIEGMQGQSLIGRYMRAATIGEMGGGGSDLFCVKLIS